MSTVRMKKGPATGPTTVRIGRPLAAMAKGGLLVTPEVRRYFRENDGELTISSATAAIVTDLLCTPPRDRSGSFSPSARGNCPRAQSLGFLGAPQAPLSAETYNLFSDGRMRHLRWQMLGLEAGFLTDVEVSVPMPALQGKGSVDGVNTKQRFAFELKGTSMPLGILVGAFQHVQQALQDHEVPRRLVPTNGKGAKGVWHIGLVWKHVHQLYSYMVQLRANNIDVDRFSLVYEHKESQNWEEFVLHPNAWMEDRCQAELEGLDTAMKRRKLPQILSECRVTPEQKCPYAPICHNPYPHLPQQWQEFMSQEVRLVVNRKRSPQLPDQAANGEPPLRRVRIIRTEPF